MSTLPDLVPVEQMALPTVVDLVNEFGDEPRRAAGESANPYPQLERPPMVAATTDDLVALANRLHPLFADPTKAPAALNRLAGATGLAHLLDERYRLVWHRTTGSDALTAAAVTTLLEFVDSHGPSRLGTCAADACVDVYTDHSQATNRRYCSPQCQNRTRVARWRNRHTDRERSR